MKTYNVGLIGFGMIGKVHAFGYATLPFYMDSNILQWAQFRITHIATAHQETAEKAKALCNAEEATTDFRAITENPNIDIVHICTPNEFHLEPLISAIRNGKHIYCEKPLCSNWAEAQQVQAELESVQYAATNQMTFHLRFFPAIMRMKQLIEEGRLGRILQFRAGYFHASNASPNIPYKWKHSPSGGVVLDLASHVLDLVDSMIGPFDSMISQTQIAYPSRPIAIPTPEEPNPLEKSVLVEDAVSILAQMQSGAHGVIEATKLATGTEDDFRIEIHGEKGAVRFELCDPHYVEFFDATASDRPLGGMSGWLKIPSGARFESPHTSFPSPKSSLGWTRAHVACLTNFLDAVVENRQTEPNLMQGVKIQELMHRVLFQENVRKFSTTPVIRDVICKLDPEWEIPNGFFFKARRGEADPEGFKRVFSALTAAANEIQRTNPPYLDRDLVAAVWFIPTFLEWQRERVANRSGEEAGQTYSDWWTTFEDVMHKILGNP